MFQKVVAPTSTLIQQLLPIMTQACAILLQEYQQYCAGAEFEVNEKLDHSPVTQADYRVHQYIAEQLAYYSDLPLLSEEGQVEQRQLWSKFWLLDPLDGTKEFLHQRAEFTINLSLIDQAKTTFAMLAIPCEGLIYIAPEQGLPLKFDISEQQWYRFVAAEDTTADMVKIGLSQSSQKKPKYAAYLTALANIQPMMLLKAGSAYKFCMMLEDKIDIYPRFHPTCEWDTSAGQCLLERIGGGLLSFSGKPFSYNQRDTLLNAGFMAYRAEKFKKIAFDALGLMLNKP